MPSKTTEMGVKHDRFRSKLAIVCKHRWKPFGVPLNQGSGQKMTLRCSKCKMTKVVQSRGAA